MHRIAVLDDYQQVASRFADWSTLPEPADVVTFRDHESDADALVDALRNGRIAGAGIDVYDEEPLPRDHPLRELRRAVLTPHLGYVTQGTYEVFYRDAVEDVAAWMGGNPLRVLEPLTR
jgi:phosphoglycerate dehydrogenase-like enzyme